jgi:hypothetical protein
MSHTIENPDKSYVLLEDVMPIYKFNFFHDKLHYEFVKDMRHLQITNTPRNIDLPQIYVPKTQRGTTKQLQNAIKYRVPVYYGTDRTDMFHWSKVSQLIGYTRNNISDDDRVISKTRYAIGGPVKYLQGLSGIVNDNSERYSVKTIHILHIWGVNLESRTTPDYLSLKNDLLANSYQSYYDRQIEIFNTIVKSSLHMAIINNKTGVNIQFPFIGAGCYLKALSNNQKNKCINEIINAIMITVSKMPKNVKMHLCIFNPNEFDASHLNKLRVFETAYSQLVVKEGNVNGNVMNNLDSLSNENNLGVVVNAWDTYSFIGNGGSKDFSVDGFMVANAGGYNDHFRNTAYLHNYVFNEHFMDSNRWILV